MIRYSISALLFALVLYMNGGYAISQEYDWYRTPTEVEINKFVKQAHEWIQKPPRGWPQHRKIINPLEVRVFREHIEPKYWEYSEAGMSGRSINSFIEHQGHHVANLLSIRMVGEIKVVNRNGKKTYTGATGWFRLKQIVKTAKPLEYKFRLNRPSVSYYEFPTEAELNSVYKKLFGASRTRLIPPGGGAPIEYRFAKGFYQTPEKRVARNAETIKGKTNNKKSKPKVKAAQEALNEALEALDNAQPEAETAETAVRETGNGTENAKETPQKSHLRAATALNSRKNEKKQKSQIQVNSRNKAVEDRRAIIAQVSEVLARITQTVKNCDLAAIQSLRKTLQGSPVIAGAPDRLIPLEKIEAAIIKADGLISKAVHLSRAANFDQGLNRLQEAEVALDVVSELSSCRTIITRIAAARTTMIMVKNELSVIDRTINSCDIRKLETLNASLIARSNSHSVLRDKRLEIERVILSLFKARLGIEKAKLFTLRVQLKEALNSYSNARKTLENTASHSGCQELISTVSLAMEAINKRLGYAKRYSQILANCIVDEAQELLSVLPNEGSQDILTIREGANKLVRIPAHFTNARANLKRADPNAAANEMEAARKILNGLKGAKCNHIHGRIDRMKSVISDIRTLQSSLIAAKYTCDVRQLDNLRRQANASENLKSALISIGDFSAVRQNCIVRNKQKRQAQAQAHAAAYCKSHHGKASQEMLDAASGKYFCICVQGYRFIQSGGQCTQIRKIEPPKKLVKKRVRRKKVTRRKKRSTPQSRAWAHCRKQLGNRVSNAVIVGNGSVRCYQK